MMTAVAFVLCLSTRVIDIIGIAHTESVEYACLKGPVLNSPLSKLSLFFTLVKLAGVKRPAELRHTTYHGPSSISSLARGITIAVASNRPTEALASVISFTFVVYSHYKHS